GPTAIGLLPLEASARIELKKQRPSSWGGTGYTPVTSGKVAAVRSLNDRLGCRRARLAAEIVEALLPLLVPARVEFDDQHACPWCVGVSSCHISPVGGLLHCVERGEVRPGRTDDSLPLQVPRT